MPSSQASTRRTLHGLAELVLAGPQHRACGDIRLRATPGGFGTVAVPDLRVDGVHLVTADAHLPLYATTFRELATAAGVEVGGPIDVYHDGSDVTPDEMVTVDPAVAAVIADAFAIGDQSLRAFAPAEDPVLWPEHFDVGISVDDVNYGVSPGDGFIDEPYAYVGPWQRREGDFWNAPFGAARPLTDLGGADAVLAFFVEGRDRR